MPIVRGPRALLIVFFIIFATSALSAVAEAQVTVIDLSGPTTAQHQSAQAINENGTVVGSITEDGISKAVSWSHGVMTRLDSVCDTCPSQASGINDLGDIVGTATQADGTRRAILWSGGSMNLLSLLPGDTDSTATDINNAGDIVGSSGAGFFTKPVRWRGGVPMSLGGPEPPLSTSQANAINEVGDIVGILYVPFGTSAVGHAFLWRNGVMTDLDASVAGPTGPAMDVNDNGVVVGLRLSFGPKATVWVDGLRSDLASGFSVAAGINNRGQIVGYLGTGFADIVGTMWENGSPTALGGAFAGDINEVGQAVGSGPVVVDGVTYTHALLFQMQLPDTPESLLSDLQEMVAGIGPGQSLASKVATVTAEFEAGGGQTCSALTPLLNEVRAQTGKKLTQAQADAINDLVARLRSLLGC